MLVKPAGRYAPEAPWINDPMAQFNPYTVPEASIVPGILVPEPDEGAGVYRDGKILVMSRFSTLPSRCLQCNAPATFRLKRKLRWHPASYYFLLIYPLTFFYPIVYWFVRWTARVQLPLCQIHRSRRRRGIWIGILVAVAGFAMAVSPTFLDKEYELISAIGQLIVILGLVWAMGQFQLLNARKIDKTHVWIKRVCPAYLDELPEVPRMPVF